MPCSIAHKTEGIESLQTLEPVALLTIKVTIIAIVTLLFVSTVHYLYENILHCGHSYFVKWSS